MTDRVHVFKVGPFEDGNAFYVPIGVDGERGEPTNLDPVEADDDVSGLQQILAQEPTEKLVCSLELADAARSLGIEVGALPADYEGARVKLAMNYAQDGALSGIESAWSHLRLMAAIRDFLESRMSTHWPPRQSFDIELRGDRTGRFAGWLADRTLTIVTDAKDAKTLALSTPTDREARLASLDHLTMTMEPLPDYALAPTRDLYGVEVMPRFEKRENGELVRATDEDALVVAGTLAALAMLDRVDEIGHSLTETPGRDVRTFVSAGLPFPFVDLQ